MNSVETYLFASFLLNPRCVFLGLGLVWFGFNARTLLPLQSLPGVSTDLAAPIPALAAGTSLTRFLSLDSHLLQAQRMALLELDESSFMSWRCQGWF